MVDELFMPEPKDHSKWAGELQQMRSHMVGQPGSPLLWISIAGIDKGDPEHFKHNHLAPLMPGFHMPAMEIPLRNTTEVLKLAGLDSKDVNKTADVGYATKTNPSYSLPPNLMAGIECRQIKVKKSDKAGIEREVEAACKEMLVRSGGKGFPLLLDFLVSLSSVVAAVQRVVGASALLYTKDGRQKNKATEAEVEKWVSRWRGGRRQDS